MQTRKRATFAEVRERTSKAALVVFSERGFDASSVQRVADEVGMSKQALMHHFPTKDSIRQLVFDDLAEDLADRFPAMNKRIRSLSHEEYRKLINDNADTFDSMPEVCRFLTRELLDRPGLTREWLSKQAWPFLAAIREAAAAGTVGEGFDAEAHAITTFSLMLSTSAFLDESMSASTKERLQLATRRLITYGSGVEEK